MAILITGAAGFIGSHVVEWFLDRGIEVCGIDLFDDFYDPQIKEANLSSARDHRGFTEIRADIRDRAALESVPDQVDAVIHLAARAGVRPSIEQPSLYTSVNVSGTVALLEFVRDRGIGSFVFASSSSVYGNNEKVPFAEDDRVDRPISPYAATKRAGELLCSSFHHVHGIGVVALRLFTVYGPRQRPDLAIHKFARLLSEERLLPVYGDGSTARDYTYIDDIVLGVGAAVDFLSARPETYEIVNLGESRTVSLSEMVEVVSSEMEVEAKIQQLPMQPGDVMRTHADVSKARRLLGYDPTTDFRVGVKKFVEWFREKGRGLPTDARG